ncbi:MAG TPA: hypothetical protein VNY04_04680 [Chthoniobacterales bacterium]|nr:hypothetical protein [Chthoniobacterales bacterium]
MRHPIDRKADHVFSIVKSEFFLNMSTAKHAVRVDRKEIELPPLTDRGDK